MKPYYYVMRIGERGRIPTVRHPTEQSAITEAERLARLNPGVAFEVLRCVTISQVPVPAITFRLDENEEGS